MFQIVVNNAPDLRNPDERQRIRSMAHTFANSRHTIGDESIQFWMDEMDRYYNTELKMNYTNSMFYKAAKHYFAAKKNEYWPEDVKWGKLGDGTSGIVAFRYVTERGKNLHFDIEVGYHYFRAQNYVILLNSSVIF